MTLNDELPGHHHAINGEQYFVRDSGGGFGHTPVLLLHGWPDDGSVWRKQIGPLCAAGYRVICIDWIGHGSSSKPKHWQRWRYDALAADINVLLDELGIARFHAVAHDYGAVFLWHYAMHHGKRLCSMAVLSAGHPMAILRSLISPLALLKSWYLIGHGLALIVPLYRWRGGTLYKAVLRGHPDRERMARDLIATDSPQYLRAWEKGNSPIAFTLAALSGRLRGLPKVTAPVLGIWSTADIFMIESQMTQSARYVSGTFRYERIEALDHWLQLEAPQKVTPLLLNWLAEQGAALGSLNAIA